MQIQTLPAVGLQGLRRDGRVRMGSRLGRAQQGRVRTRWEGEGTGAPPQKGHICTGLGGKDGANKAKYQLRAGTGKT